MVRQIRCIWASLVVFPFLAAEASQAEEQKTIVNSIGMKLVLVPAGEFRMGSSESADSLASVFPGAEPIWFEDELPAHDVRITRPFYMGQYEVTLAEFRKFMEEQKTSGEEYLTDAEKTDKDENPSPEDRGKTNKGGWGWSADDVEERPGTVEKTLGFLRKSAYTWQDPGFEQTDYHPVVNVSWNDANKFCEWLSQKENATYRLPTEAEWEYACRAGSSSRFSFGDDVSQLTSFGNVADKKAREQFPNWETADGDDGFVFTAPVGNFRPNAFGLSDMHGNVWEWCADGYNPNFYEDKPTEDPVGPQEIRYKSVRGGGWFLWPRHCRSSYRGGLPASTATEYLGFRVVKNATP